MKLIIRTLMFISSFVTFAAHAGGPSKNTSIALGGLVTGYVVGKATATPKSTGTGHPHPSVYQQKYKQPNHKNDMYPAAEG